MGYVRIPTQITNEETGDSAVSWKYVNEDTVDPNIGGYSIDHNMNTVTPHYNYNQGDDGSGGGDDGSGGGGDGGNGEGGEGGGGGGGSDAVIPEDAFPWSRSGLPERFGDLAYGLAKNLQPKVTGVTDTMYQNLMGFKPFDWYGNLGKSNDYFTGASTGARNALYDALQRSLHSGSQQVSSNLAGRGLGMVAPNLAPQVYGKGMDAYANAMADLDVKAAQNAAALTEAMSEGTTNEYLASASMIYDLVNAMSNLLGQTKYSYSEDKLAPIKVLLGLP